MGLSLFGFSYPAGLQLVNCLMKATAGHQITDCVTTHARSQILCLGIALKLRFAFCDTSAEKQKAMPKK